jgi:ribosomal-protein-alanine N-acetyltransferase
MDAIKIGVRAHMGDKLFLEVAEDNAAARRLYESYGFKQIGRRPGYYKRPGGPAMAALTMRCNLV